MTAASTVLIRKEGGRVLGKAKLLLSWLVVGPI
jgi:hypothetical protein